MDRITLKVDEMANLLGISRAKAFDLANAKDFSPSIRLGRRIIIYKPALDKWLEAKTQIR